MKSFKGYLKEFSGDGLPAAGPRYKVFHHRVEQETDTSNIEGSGREFDYPDKENYGYEPSYTHDLGHVALPVDDPKEAHRILKERVDKFHMATALSHEHNFPENFIFNPSQDLKGHNYPSENEWGQRLDWQNQVGFAMHVHGDGHRFSNNLGEHADVIHYYHHHLDPVENSETAH